jgi:catechol 2,3-dioxygenase-like lactoylglutathione lyase family enzyme
MLSSADLVAFVATRDLETAHRFYGGVLGFERVEASSFANVYDAHGTQLRVTHVQEPATAPYTVLGWRVADIVREIEALEAAGVAFKRYDGMNQDGHGLWTSPSGARIAWFADPDGNVLSLQATSTQVR